jgi:hypothetical protein
MKKIIFYFAIVFLTSIVYGQSSIEYSNNTSLFVGTGSDVCASTITMNGTLSGDGTFCNSPTDVETEENKNIPLEYSLSQNYPNPFNPNTTIKYSIKEKGYVKLVIVDIVGNIVSVLVNEEKPAGIYSINFNSSEYASGVYFYKIQSGSFIETKKMILLK